jgi:hypothetical protein
VFPWMRLEDVRNLAMRRWVFSAHHPLKEYAHLFYRLNASRRDNQLYLGVLCMVRFSGEQSKEAT